MSLHPEAVFKKRLSDEIDSLHNQLFGLKVVSDPTCPPDCVFVVPSSLFSTKTWPYLEVKNPRHIGVLRNVKV